jgi:hypothetical protein
MHMHMPCWTAQIYEEVAMHCPAYPISYRSYHHSYSYHSLPQAALPLEPASLLCLQCLLCLLCLLCLCVSYVS